MNNEKKNFDCELVEWPLICRDLYQHRWMGGPDATPDLWKQPFSAVRASGGYSGNTEGVDSCDLPCNLTQVGFKSSIYLARVTLKFNGWPCKQGKSEGFESCDRPIVRKCRIWVKIGDVLSPVTLKSDGWPWKTIGHLFFAVSSFVQHFIAIGAFKLELQSGNAQFGSNSTIFRAMWPWKLTDDLEKQ